MCLARKQCQQSRTSKPRFKTGTTHISSANYYLACVCTPRRSGRQRRAVRSPHLRDVALSISLDAPSGGRRGRQHTPRRRRNDLQDWITGSWSNSRSPSEQVWRVLELDHHRARAFPPPHLHDESDIFARRSYGMISWVQLKDARPYGTEPHPVLKRCAASIVTGSSLPCPLLGLARNVWSAESLYDQMIELQ